MVSHLALDVDAFCFAIDFEAYVQWFNKHNIIMLLDKLVNSFFIRNDLLSKSLLEMQVLVAILF